MRQSVRRLITPVAVGLAVLLAGAGGYRAWRARAKSHGTRPVVATVAPTPGEPSVEIGPYNVVVPLPGQGARTWEAKARAIEGDMATRAGRLLDVTCIMYESGQETLRVRGDSADIRLLAGGTSFSAAVRGHVRAWAMQRNMLLTADEFSWLSTEDKAHVLKPVWEGLGLRNSAERGSFNLALTHGTLNTVSTTHE